MTRRELETLRLLVDARVREITADDARCRCGTPLTGCSPDCGACLYRHRDPRKRERDARREALLA